MYTWHRCSSYRHKILRSKAKKKYINRQNKRQANKTKYAGKRMYDEYAKDIDHDTSSDNTEPSAKKSKPTSKPTHACPYCDRSPFTVYHWLPKHIQKEHADKQDQWKSTQSDNVCICCSLRYSLQSAHCYLFARSKI